MDKKKLVILEDQINKKYGKGTIYRLGDDECRIEIPRVTTGVDELDDIVGGGLPKGRLVEIAGSFSAGKTTLAKKIASNYEDVVFFDMEGTFDEDIARIHGLQDDQVSVVRPEYGEVAFDMMIEYAKAGIPLIILDSVPALNPRAEYESVNSEKQTGVAQIPRLISRRLPILMNYAAKNGTVVLFINQVRAKMSAMAFGDPFDEPGGHALKHAASLKLRMARKAWIKAGNDSNGNPVHVGQLCVVKVTKSKVCKPKGLCEIPLIFEEGFVKHEDLKEVVTRLKGK